MLSVSLLKNIEKLLRKVLLYWTTSFTLVNESEVNWFKPMLIIINWELNELEDDDVVIERMLDVKECFNSGR